MKGLGIDPSQKTGVFLMLFLLLSSFALAATSPDGFGCSPDSFTFVEGPEVRVAVRGMDYVPRCLAVRPGTRVTIVANRVHPLAGVDFIDQPKNPMGTEVVQADKVAGFETPGLFGYRCVAHSTPQGQGMAGVILVKERN
jgi:plastocyanin